MFSASATHRGAPFVGRSREIGLLNHLVEEGLEGAHRLIRVAGEVGMGRRRLLAEALLHGRDAEWIHLAPGGVEADFRRWMETELQDLLDTYPDAPYPSWPFHVLAGWVPALGKRAGVPALSRERIPAANAPEILGSAIGALLVALTGRTMLIVDAGLWAAPGSARARALESLTRALAGPGTITLAAVPLESPPEIDAEGVRTVRLGPLTPFQVEELVDSWGGEDRHRRAAWLWRVTGGKPLFLHEVVRWLEELGHAHVDEEHSRVEFLTPLPRLPVPLTLHAVMETRFRRLPPEAVRLMALLADHDGRLDTSALRRLYNGGDGDTFDEALTALRRREFLLRRTSLRPLALSTPAWKGIVASVPLRLRRGPRRRKARNGTRPVPASTPLARATRLLEEIRRDWARRSRDTLHVELASLFRTARGRPGPAWDGIRGRIATAAARLRLGEQQTTVAHLWVRWGLSQLATELHPTLRRELMKVEMELLEREGRPAEANRLRARAREEALAAGHPVAAARLRAALAEGARRKGRPALAERDAARAERELLRLGLDAEARPALHTLLHALLDQRELDRFRDERVRAGEDEQFDDLNRLAAGVEWSPPFPLGLPVGEAPGGWGFGLDRHDLWETLRSRVQAVRMENGREGFEIFDRVMGECRARLEEVGHRSGLADLAEIRLWAWLEADSPAGTDDRLAEVIDAAERVGSESRLRYLAEALGRTAAALLPTYTHRLATARMHAVSLTVVDETEEVQLRFLGRPRVEGAGGEWPMALWPEWWERLWSMAVASVLEERPLLQSDVVRALAETGDAPPENLETLVHEATVRLFGGSRPGGGLHARGDRVVVAWGGIGSDVRELIEGLERARERDHAGDPTEARRLRDEALDRAEGDYLPGREDAEALRLRARVRSLVAEALAARLENPGSIPLERLVAWVDGCGRVSGRRARLAELIRSWTRRLAAVPRPGSP